MKEALTTCACQHCGKFIEFDRRDLPGGEAITVECPHCKQSTVIFARKQENPQAEPPEFVGPRAPENKRSASLMRVGSIFLFLIGLGLVLEGCGGSINESTRETGSAIREAVYAVQYGSGFIVLALSMILYALSRIIVGD